MTNIWNCYSSLTALTKAIDAQVMSVKVHIKISSVHSDLEAFSLNAADDSFAALASQPTA